MLDRDRPSTRVARNGEKDDGDGAWWQRVALADADEQRACVMHLAAQFSLNRLLIAIHIHADAAHYDNRVDILGAGGVWPSRIYGMFDVILVM